MSFAILITVSMFALKFALNAEASSSINYYKDYLRSKPDDSPVADIDGEKFIYFYRTPAHFITPEGYDSITAMENDMGKRTSNMFKNHMLNKDAGFQDSVVVDKRITKTLLSKMLKDLQTRGNIITVSKSMNGGENK